MHHSNDQLSLRLLNSLLRAAPRDGLTVELLSTPAGQGLGWVSVLARVNGLPLTLVHHADGRFEVAEAMQRRAPAVEQAATALLQVLVVQA